MADQETLNVYAARAKEYADRFSSKTPSLHLAAFMLAVKDKGRVLDLGCGTGQATAFMRAEGLEVEAVDASPEMAAIASQKFDIDVRIAEFNDLDSEGAYGGVYANFSLLHAPKSEMPTHLARVSKALVSGGIFHIALKTGEGEHRDSLGRLYAYYTDAEITKLLADAGFIVIERSFGVDKGLDGSSAPWIILLTGKVR